MPALAATWGREVELDDSGPFPMRVYRSRRHHTAEILIDARRFADRVHLVQGEVRLTFAEHEDAVLRVADRLVSAGVRPGDAVLLLAANGIAWVVAYWGILRAGGVVVLGNPWWSAVETAEIHRRIDPSLSVVDAAWREGLPAAARVVLTSELEELLLPEAPVPAVPAPTATEHDPAVVMFSAGTTGVPKGVVLPHRAMLANVHNILNVSRSLPHELDPSREPNVALHTLPLFHAGGLQTLGVGVMAGTRMVFLPDRFDAGEALRLIEAERVTHWAGVPTMVSRMMDHPDFAHRDTSSLRSVVLAGSAVPEALRERVARAFSGVRQGGGINYGLTETGGTVCSASAEQARTRPGTVGRPVPVAELRIEPDAEHGTRPGEGEILVRSPGLMLGYWGEPDTAVEDGWLRTGDIGRLDDDGWLYLAGRKKDIIIRAGENIASGQVEDRLRSHPDVLDAAVVSLEHPDLGEEVGAAVVRRDGAAVDVDELRAFAAEALPRFAVPTRWWLRRDPLPTNAVGKVLKRQIAEEFPP